MRISEEGVLTKKELRACLRRVRGTPYEPLMITSWKWV